MMNGPGHLTTSAASPIGARGAWLRLAAAALCVLALGACAQNQPELPSLAKDPRKLLTKAEQERAISDLGKSKEAEVTAAQKQIQQSK